jgi:voltage-gated potassium channel
MIKQYNYVLLLVGLLFMLVGGSVGTENPHVSTRIVVDVTLLAVFLFGVWSLVESKIAFTVGWCLGGLAAVLIIGAYATDRVMLQYLALVAVLAFLLITCLIAVYDVLFGGTIDINRLVGAGCIYLMSGTIWGIVYFLLSLISPGSFEGIAAESWGEQLNEFVYHSFVTLTTLGYGDVTPVLPVARAICYLEAVLGQLYLTVLVAALVGMHIANRHLVVARNKGEPGS